MDQRVPAISDSNVDRVLRRDFAPDRVSAAAVLLARINAPEAPRVRLAALKLALGDLAKLENAVDLATADYRDVIISAEYRRYAARYHIESATSAAEDSTADSNEYQAWLSATTPQHAPFSDAPPTKHWYPFDDGRTIGTNEGSEFGLLIADEEFAGSARISIERTERVPFVLTCAVYGTMLHTRYFDSEADARAAYEQMKMGLATIVDALPLANDPYCDFGPAIKLITEFIDRFP